MIILKVGPLPPPERAISVSVRDALMKPHMDGSAGRQLHVRALSIYVHRCFAIGLLCRRACVAPPCPHSLSRRPQRAGLQRSPRLSVSSVSVSDAWGFPWGFMGLLRIDGASAVQTPRMKFPDFGHGHGTDDRHGHQPSRPPVARPCLPAPSFVQHLTRHQDHNRKGPLRSGRKSAFYGAEGFYLYARGGVKVKALRVSISWASLIRGRHSGEQSGQYAALVPCVHPLRPSLLLFEHLINRCVRVRIRV